MATARATMATARLSSGAFASGSRGSRGGKPRGGGTADHLEMAKNAKNTTRANAKSKRGASKSFIILPADGGFAATEAGGGGWTLWQESEAGSVLVGTRRARRRRQQMSDHWRKIMSLGGVEGAAPEDVSRRLDAALAALEREREAIAKVLHELERSNKGADVMAAEVKRLKVQKLQAQGRRRARAQSDAVRGGGARARRGLLRARLPGPRRRRGRATSQSRWRTCTAPKTPSKTPSTSAR